MNTILNFFQTAATRPRLIVIAFLYMLVAGCGYQLSGNDAQQGRILSPLLKTVSLEGLKKYDPMHRALVSALHDYGIKVTSPATARTRIIILDKNEEGRVMVTGEDAETAEYLLIVKLKFVLKEAGEGDRKTLLKKSTLHAETSYIYDPYYPLVNRKERRRASAEIERQLSRKMMDRLIAMSASRS